MQVRFSTSDGPCFTAIAADTGICSWRVGGEIRPVVVGSPHHNLQFTVFITKSQIALVKKHARVSRLRYEGLQFPFQQAGAGQKKVIT